MKNYRQGFTLLELMVTVLIFGILALATLPNLAPLKAKQDLSQGVALVEEAFRQAQERALSQGYTVHLIFDLKNNQYWLCETPGGGCIDSEKIALPNLPNGIYFMDTDFIDSSNVDGNGEATLDDEVAFDFQGRVVDPGDVLGRVVIASRQYAFTPYEIYLGSLTGTTWILQRPLSKEKNEKP